ncbi:MAG TPA: SPOR domain-containing protein [Acidisphaera sp.]|nr:SPOR domain-containing protein [Acidisphaera sp.]
MATDRLDMPTYRAPRSAGLDGGTKRLALTALGLGGALVVVLGLWTVSGHRRGDIPVIRAEPGPYRVKPTDPGGMQVNGADEDVLGTGRPGVDDKLAPPPETPEPSALRTTQSAPTANAAPAPAPAPAATSPAPAPAAAPPGASAPAASVAPAIAPAAATPAPRTTPAAPMPPHAAAQPGATEVQLAAVASEDDAQKEWARLSHKAPELLGDRRPLVTRFERDGKTFFRVRTGGFADVAEATRFCEQARAKGLACSIAAF